MVGNKSKMGKPATPKKQTKENLTSDQPNIHLIDIYFQSGDWHVDRDKLGSRNRLEVGFKTEILEQDSRHSYFLQKFNLAVKPENVDETVVTIACEIVVKCTSDQDVSSDFWKTYEQTTLAIISVPYFREFVFSLSGKMGIPPIHVPHWVR